MHTSAAIVAALSAFSLSPVEAKPIERRAGVGFTLQQQVYGKRLKNGPIALGNLYKKVGANMPSEVHDAFAVATESQAPANINKRATSTSSTLAGKPKPTSSTTSTPTPSPSPTTSRTSSTSSTPTSGSRTSSVSSSSATSSSTLSSSSPSVASGSTGSSSSSLSSTVSPTVGSPAAVSSSSSTFKSASVSATPVNQFDTAYMIPIALGGTNVMVDLDTGSSDLWAFSNLQPSSQTTGHNVYAPNQINLMQGQTWNVSYLDGSNAGGVVYVDNVTLGGTTFSNIPVEAAQSASDAFVQAAYDGILGMAFDSLNTVRPTQQKTFFSNIMNQLPTKLFTSLLKANAPGSFDFGFIDSSKYTGSINYATVDPSSGWWQFQTQGYSVGTGAAVSQSFAGVVDTGTTLMVLPSSIVSAYYAQVTNATYSSDYAGWIYPCTAVLPNLNVVINGSVATVPGKLLTYGPIDYVGNCYGGLQQNDNIGVAIYGDIFIKSQFIVYDQSTSPPRVGFARQAGLSYS